MGVNNKYVEARWSRIWLHALPSTPELVSELDGLFLNHLQSHIRDHLFSCNGPQVNLKHIDIIGTCPNKTELRILESLHILQSKSTLNYAICSPLKYN